MARLSLARAADAARRREVERHLAARGGSGARRFPPPAGTPLDVEGARELARATTGLGPVFAAFAHYLSWRADLCEPAACLELAEAPCGIAPAPAAAVAERLVEELGATAAELFDDFEVEPVSSDPLWQVHRAVLPGRRAVLVHLRRPGLEREIERDLPLLPLLRAVWHGSQEDLADAIAGFGAALEAAIDAHAMAAALIALAAPARVRAGEPPSEASVLLTAPAVETSFSTAAVLTVSALAGRRLAAGQRFPGTPSARENPGPAPGAGRYGVAYDLAPRMALAWFELAFAGERFPLEADLLLLEGGRIAVGAGTFTRLAGSSRGCLWEYLCATADHDPERAAERLLAELAPGPQADAALLEKRLRQLAPLGDRRLSAFRDGLAGHLLAHWQLARRCGFTARPALADFYRGVFWLSCVTARLAPAEAGFAADDPLAIALEDLRWRSRWSEWRRLGLEPGAALRLMESYALSLADLPRQMEAALDRLEKRQREPPTAPVRDDRRRHANIGTAVAALGMLMAAVALVAGRLAATMPAGRRWIEGVAAILFAGLGALLLGLARGAARTRKDR